jgi:hypothetical protein
MSNTDKELKVQPSIKVKVQPPIKPKVQPPVKTKVQASYKFPDDKFIKEEIEKLEEGMADYIKEAEEHLAVDIKEAEERLEKFIAEEPCIEIPDILIEDSDFIIDDSPPQPPPRPDAAPKEIAEFMKEHIKGDYLYQQTIAQEIKREFGDKWLYKNENDNPAIKKEVLDEFREITPDLRWSRSGFFWRKRRPTDDPNKRQGKRSQGVKFTTY